MRFINYLPPRIAILFVLVAIALHGLIPEWGRFHTHSWFGISLAIIGFAVMLWGWRLFKEQAVAICPTAETARLVTHAIYRLTRNPMYLGLILMLLGLSVYVGSLPYYLATAAYFSVMNWVFCPYEEAKLENTFGKRYLTYKNSVRRWL